jgi:hypothetical protein
MITLIVRFLELILTIFAALTIGILLLAGMHIGRTWGIGVAGSFIGASLGAICGLFLVTVVLGVPVLLLRINENLEHIRSELSRRNSGKEARPGTGVSNSRESP